MAKRPVIGLNMSMERIDKYEKYGLLVPLGYVDAVARRRGLAALRASHSGYGVPQGIDLTIRWYRAYRR